MTENEARYIVRMIRAFNQNTLFLDATDADAEEQDRMKARYDEAGRWEKGKEAALSEFIIRVVKNGVPGGEYLHLHIGESLESMDLHFSRHGIPRIERPTEIIDGDFGER